MLLGLPIFPATVLSQTHLPKSPKGLQSYYLQASPENRNNVANATGTFIFLLWNGPSAETDTVCAVTWSPSDSESVLVCSKVWQGYRVRRTVEGITPGRLETVGQWKARDRVTSICLASQQPYDLRSAMCVPQSQDFVFTGTGVFFKGFRNNRQPNGQYVLDYPKGSPADSDSTARVFVDPAGIVGFRTEYAVTSIDTVYMVNSDFYESPVDSTELIHLTPATAPAENLESVAVVPNPYKQSAEWDPAPGERRVHFIHIPAGSTVRVYTASGELLRTMTQDPYSSPGGVTGELEWDLQNDRGRSVVSGIYMYTVSPPDGRTPRKGHFVIIK